MDMPAGTPSEATRRSRSARAPLLVVDNLVVDYRISRRTRIRAVSGVSFRIREGETLGLVGESGCGKTTVARAIVNLQPPTAGRIVFAGKRLTDCGWRRGNPSNIQMIFQDATASLNPRRSVGKTIAEPLRAAGANDRRTRFRLAAELMEKVGLEPASAFGRRPFEFSSGQCQRISIARALITSPKLLICDEPVSSLDVSVQAQILNLLRKMKARYDLTMLFISHDLAVIKNVSDTVAVMYMGALCEVAPAAVFFPSPLHPYSAILLAAVPGADADKRIYRRSKASAAVAVVPAFASGCHFHARCPYARSRCAKHRPELREITPERLVACHFPLQSPSAHNSR